MCVNILLACISVHHVCLKSVVVKGGVGFLGTEVTDSKLPCRCWNLNPGPFKEQPHCFTH